MALRAQCIPGNELDDGLCAAWQALRQRVPQCDSPYFSPHFTRAVAAVRRDVEVAVLEQAGKIVGFFPYQRGRLNWARPVGGRLSDFHAPLLAAELRCSPAQLLSACRLSAWSFDHLLAPPSLAPWAPQLAASPSIDLSGGFENYLAALRVRRSRLVAEMRRMQRHLHRDVGPVQFVLESTDLGVLRTLLCWKSAQYRRTGLTDIFRFPWIVQLLRSLLEGGHGELTGFLSALTAGDRLLAAHYGLRSGAVLHWWFPAYDREMARYSPGRLLLLRTAEYAHHVGATRIDLGKGDDRFKTSFQNGEQLVGEGVWYAGALPRRIDQLRGRARQAARRAKHTCSGWLPASWLFHLREWLEFR